MSETILPRGATIRFTTTFYDVDGAVTQPSSAVINVVYPDADGEEQTVELPLAFSGDVAWTVDWDTRDVGPGVVFYSVHSENSGIPFAVEDGRFSVSANAANLPTF